LRVAGFQSKAVSFDTLVNVESIVDPPESSMIPLNRSITTKPNDAGTLTLGFAGRAKAFPYRPMILKRKIKPPLMMPATMKLFSMSRGGERNPRSVSTGSWTRIRQDLHGGEAAERQAGILCIGVNRCNASGFEARQKYRQNHTEKRENHESLEPVRKQASPHSSGPRLGKREQRDQDGRDPVGAQTLRSEIKRHHLGVGPDFIQKPEAYRQQEQFCA
jgi:hypothetical protein